MPRPGLALTSMTSLIISGVIIVLLIAVIWLALRTGRQSAQKEAAEKGVKVKDEQIKAALERPDRDSLIDKLRRGKF